MLSEFQKLKFDRVNFFRLTKSIPLHSTMLNCGHECETSMDYRWNGLQMGNRELAIFQYTLAGFGKLDYDGETYTISPGEAMLLTVPEEHCYYFPDDSDSWEFIFINMVVRLVGPLMHATPCYARQLPNSVPVML